jgi:hypothetical protein
MTDIFLLFQVSEDLSFANCKQIYEGRLKAAISKLLNCEVNRTTNG